MSRNVTKIMAEGDGGYHMSKSDVGQAFRAARKLKGLYDFSHFKRKNNKQKGTK
jgi:hypothetical protein